MDLYLVQHGDARSKEEDPERPLSDKGTDDVRKVANAIAPASIGKLLHSGKLRAAQTAYILGEALGVDAAATDGLAPMDDPSVWAERLNGETTDTMLVGHLPHMGRLASLLLCRDPERGVVEFRMGAVLCLFGDEGRWAVRWMIVP